MFQVVRIKKTLKFNNFLKKFKKTMLKIFRKYTINRKKNLKEAQTTSRFQKVNIECQMENLEQRKKNLSNGKKNFRKKIQEQLEKNLHYNRERTHLNKVLAFLLQKKANNSYFLKLQKRKQNINLSRWEETLMKEEFQIQRENPKKIK